jgi:anti-anti-sigma factor
MLDIDMEFKGGILFLRLSGVLASNTYTMLDNLLKRLILNNDVRFITFNVAGLNYIDAVGINTIVKYNKALLKIKGKALICGLYNDLVKLRVRNSKIINYIDEVNDELGALKIINLGGCL